ncbi:MAG: VanW family protein [Pyrinomonadaceae bacterium]|nr:VanW family protein [Pyrinomonadaceae bacterium]
MENKLAKAEIHSIVQTFNFQGKAKLLQLKRGFKNLFDTNLNSFPKSEQLSDSNPIAESKTELWTETEPEERFLIAGKIENLRLAVKKINGIVIPANRIFSFWKQIGKAGRLNGFVVGRELREGCIIPNVGGGLCQLSNALYDAALQANFQIVERHAHTQIIKGSLAEKGRDATVFWNYVDLRFKSPFDFRIEAELDAENLIVRFKAVQKISPLVQIQKRNTTAENQHHPHSCATCGVEDCFRVVETTKYQNFGKTAFLLDEFSPEFDEYIQKTKSETDICFLPLDGKRFSKPNYAWTTGNFSETKQSFLTTLIRSYKSRRLAKQGAERQKNLLAMSEKLAKSFAKNLKHDVLHIVVQQNLLPFLWREGILGGRTFDVLMNSLPIEELQKRLDFACSLHPESKTPGDFRAAGWLVKAETEALKNARKIITAHTEIAKLFPEKSELLKWHLPKTKDRKPKTENLKPLVVFPASTVARKGAYELREAIRGLNVKVMILGAELEGADFWQGFDLETDKSDWLEKADLVVAPAFVEHQPRRILQAFTHKIPLIVSTSCGVETLENIELMEAGKTEDLKLKLQNILAKI